MKSDADRLREIFSQAQQIESDTQRGRYLTDACIGDTELRRQIDSLLKAEKEAGDFLAQTIQLPSADFEPELIGCVIGRYKLLEKIGEGGFGVVYMGEQHEPMQRKVALKIIKPGMDTREVIARFEAERQALALMDHPNIAKVLDGGTTEAKRPYFVMELVRGIPITDYCDLNNLSTTDRLQLFIKVCQAVQHAHLKAVIHRDLKPSNILVTLLDGEPVPKVIDFGVAKALGQKLTERTLFTAFRQMIGTPAYMSPEQAEMSGLDVDTRSDIYSLGVLLYELLTGVTPFDKEALAKAGLDEIRRMIREADPPKPSTRLRTLGDKLSEVAKHRHTEPAALRTLVHGDLDWIVMKSLEKDRHRRYETPSALAQDVARHLRREPVLAVAPSKVYRIAKCIRRHRTSVSFMALALILLALGITVAVVAPKLRRANRVMPDGRIVLVPGGSPITVAPGQKKTLVVKARDSSGHALSEVSIQVDAGGGRFLERENLPYDPTGRLHGPYSASGTTDANGTFTTWWVCNPCASGYVLNILAQKEGFTRSVTNYLVEIRQ